MFGKVVKNYFTGGAVTVSGGSGGTGGAVSAGAGGNVVLVGSPVQNGGSITINGGGTGNLPGNQNITIGPTSAKYQSSYGLNQLDSEFTIFSEDSGEWMRWAHKSQKAEFKICGEWFVVQPKAMPDRHPLDFGSAIDSTGKEDLDEIRVQYETHIKKTPWLQKLRKDYDELLEKHKLFDAIRGDDDATD